MKKPKWCGLSKKRYEDCVEYYGLVEIRKDCDGCPDQKPRKGRKVK